MSGDLTDRKKIFYQLFHPESIAVIGASNDESKPGGRIIKNILDQGYTGSLLAINPGNDSIKNLPTFPGIKDLPSIPDLAIIAIPARFVAGALQELADKKVESVIVLSAGFSETGEEGKKNEQKLLEIASNSNITLLGPNCMGIMTPTYAGKFAGIVPELKKGSVDMISCSGATVDQIMEQATIKGLSFCNVVTTGNSAQLGVEDILVLVDENYGPDSSPILILYMESIKNPSKLLHHARSLTEKGCTIIGVKSGVTQFGNRAAASHTGAIATNNTAVDALFEKAGIIRVRSKVELIDVAVALYISRNNLKANRVCIITDAGGPGVMLSDELSRQGLEVPVLKDSTRKRLMTILPPESPMNNPIDCLPTRNGEQIEAIFKVLEEEEKDSIDSIVIITSNSMLRDNWDTYEAIIDGMNKKSGIPVFPILSPGTTGVELIEKFKSFGKPYYHDEVPVAKAFGKIVNRPHLSTPAGAPENYNKERIRNIVQGQNHALGPESVKEILLAAGFQLPAQLEIYEKDQLKSACTEVGFPLVMKVIGTLHKSDTGGVRIGINNMEMASEAWVTLMSLNDAKGVMLQQMIEGHEVILGTSREEGFGHLTMFGLGGVYTEILKDVRFALAPLSEDECLGLVHGIRSVAILKGARGAKGMSIPKIAENIQRISSLVTDFPVIREIDLNPLKGFGDELFAVDARIILEEDQETDQR